MSTRPWEGITIPQPGTFDLDVAHTRIGFVAKHMMVTKVRGRFEKFSGNVTLAGNPLESSAELTIQAASVETGSADRDTHLRGEDFLAVEKFPEITFRGARVLSHSDDEFIVTGDLTIRDVTKEVTLKVEYGGAATSPWGQEIFGFSLTTEIDREDFGLTWNVALEAGGVLVGKKVKIEIEGEATRRV